MTGPVEKSALERQVDDLQARVGELETLISDLHVELHAATDPLRLAMLIMNRMLAQQAKRLGEVVDASEVSGLEALFAQPAHEEPDAPSV